MKLIELNSTKKIKNFFIIGSLYQFYYPYSKESEAPSVTVWNTPFKFGETPSLFPEPKPKVIPFDSVFLVLDVDICKLEIEEDSIFECIGDTIIELKILYKDSIKYLTLGNKIDMSINRLS